MTGAGPNQPRFDDGKDARALRTIGEVAKALGIKQHVLRYWEQQFPMLTPLKRSGGRRYYRADDIMLVRKIDRLVNAEGYTLRGARQAIEGGNGSESEPPAGDAFTDTEAKPAPQEYSPDVLPQLQAIRGRLAQALDAA